MLIDIHLPFHTNRALLIFVIICLMLGGSSCYGLSLIPSPTQTALPLPSLTPTPEECSWSGLALAWNDSNANGIREATEPPLSDINFFSEHRSPKSEKFDWGITGTGGSIGMIVMLPGCTHTQFEVYPEVPQNCRLTTPARILADTRKDNEEFSFGFSCH